MGNGAFNVARGRLVRYFDLPDASDQISFELLRGTIQADDTLNNHLTLASVLAANTRADFTNYAPLDFSSGITIVQNNTTNLQNVDLIDLTWFSAGGPVSGNNTVTKVLACYKPTSTATTTQTIPLLFWDANSTTTGTDLLLQVNAAGLFDA